jgi:4-alpha-glucanotransferase
VLTLTTARADGHVVGENLGTVPPETNRALRRHGILGMYVVPFELDAQREQPLREPTARELACLDTHDTPTFSTWWHDLAPRERGALLQRLRDAGCLDTTYGEGVDPEDVLGAVLEFLGLTRAEVVLATLEDLWLEVEAQNVPGTTTAVRPNFRRRAAHSLDELEQATTVSDALQRLDRARRAKQRV